MDYKEEKENNQSEKTETVPNTNKLSPTDDTNNERSKNQWSKPNDIGTINQSEKTETDKTQINYQRQTTQRTSEVRINGAKQTTKAHFIRCGFAFHDQKTFPSLLRAVISKERKGTRRQMSKRRLGERSL